MKNKHTDIKKTMARSTSIFLGLLVGAVLMAGWSCSDDDNEEERRYPHASIVFGGVTKADIKATRAGEGGNDPASADLPLSEYSDEFRVTGYKFVEAGSGNGSGEDVLSDVINNYLVRHLGSSAGSSVTDKECWEYVGQSADQVTKDWDFAAMYYRFMGYVPQRKTPKGSTGYAYNVQTEQITRGGHNYFTISLIDLQLLTIRNDVEYFVGTEMNSQSSVSKYDLPLISDLRNDAPMDLWNETTNTMSPVKMTFRVPLSKVKVMFMRSANANVEARDATIRDVTFAPVITSVTQHRVAQRGTYVVTYPLDKDETQTSWNVIASSYKDNLTFEPLIRTDEEGNACGILDEIGKSYPATPQYVLLPRVGENTPFRLTATIGGLEQTCEVPAELMEWQPGYEYTYIFKVLSGGGIISLSAVEVELFNPVTDGYDDTGYW